MIKIVFSVVLLLLVFFSLNAQDFSFYKNLIDLEEKEAITKLKEFGFKEVKFEIIQGCHAYKFEKETLKVIYNLCFEENERIVNFQVMSKSLEDTYELFLEANLDSTLFRDTSTIGPNSSFIFIEDGLKEMYFVFDHRIELYVLEGSNMSRFDFIKEFIENGMNFNPNENIISIFRDLMDHTNEFGESIEDILRDFEIKRKPTILDCNSSKINFDGIKKSKNFEELRKVVDKKLLSDKNYVKKVKSSLKKMKNSADPENTYLFEDFEEVVIKIAIENNKFKTILMLNYIIEKLK